MSYTPKILEVTKGGTGQATALSLNNVLQAMPDNGIASLALSNPGISILGSVFFYGDVFAIYGINESAVQPVAHIASPATPGNIDNGDHTYVFTYVGSSDDETSASPPSAVVTITNNAVNGQATITVPVSSDPGVVLAFLYRDFNSDGVYVQVSGVVPGVPYVDNLDNASLPGGSPPLTNQNGNLYVGNRLNIVGNLNGGGTATFNGGDIFFTTAAIGSTINGLTLRPHVGVDTFGLKIGPVSAGGPSFDNNLAEIYKFKSSAQTLVFTVNDFGDVSIGGALSGTASALEIISTTKGFLPPRMTTTQRNAITPVEGLEVYDLTLHGKFLYNGTTWVQL